MVQMTCLVCNKGERLFWPITKPPTKEEEFRLRRQRDEVKIVDVRFETRQVAGLGESHLCQNITKCPSLMGCHNLELFSVKKPRRIQSHKLKLAP